jgi:hypothetical protein
MARARTGSISGWAMSFKSALCVGLCGWMAAGGAALGAAPGDDYVGSRFAAPPPAATLVLNGPVGTGAREILGHAPLVPEVRYWFAEGQTVWVLHGRHKTGVYIAGFSVQDGRLADVQVLEYRARYGQGIRERSFTRQFADAALNEGRQLDRRIDGITGATISVNSMKNLARLALYLDSVVPR